MIKTEDFVQKPSVFELIISEQREEIYLTFYLLPFPSNLYRSLRVHLHPRRAVLRRRAEAGFDGEQAVVFRKPLASAGRARFDEG